MINLFLNIQNKLLTVVPYVDENWGQLNDYGAHMPVKFPCCLLDINNFNYEDIGQDKTASPNHRQTATGTLRILVATQKLTNSSGLASLNQKNIAFGVFNVIEQIHTALHGYKPVANGGALMRTSMRRISNDAGLQQYELTYSFSQTNV